MSRPTVVPFPLRIAAVLFLLYAAAVIVDAVLARGTGDWIIVRDLPWVVARAVLALGVAAGLWQQRRWAWWGAVALAIVGLGAGAVPYLVSTGGDLHWPAPSLMQLAAAVGFGALAAALLCLLTPSGRGIGRPTPR